MNDTFLTLADSASRQAFVMQRLNTEVFEQPELVMRNLLRLGDHVEQKLAAQPPELTGRRWEVPRVLPTLDEDGHWVEHQGEFWRSIGYIGAATTSDVIENATQARELGYGLGMFHHLISDLPTKELADTLENFHVTPAYLAEFDAVMANVNPSTDDQLSAAVDFVNAHGDKASMCSKRPANQECFIVDRFTGTPRSTT